MTPTEQFRRALLYLLEHTENASQADLADATGTKRSYLNDFIKERVPGSEAARVKWAAYFGYSYLDMLAIGHCLINGDDPALVTKPLITANELEIIDRQIDELEKKLYELPVDDTEEIPEEWMDKTPDELSLEEQRVFEKKLLTPSRQLQFALQQLKQNRLQQIFGNSLKMAISSGMFTVKELDRLARNHLAVKEIQPGNNHHRKSKNKYISNNNGLVQVPVLTKIPDFFPEIDENQIEHYIALPGAPKNCYAFKIIGESMEPSVRHDDYVLFVADREAKSGDIVVVNDEFGDSMVKRLKEKNGEQFLANDNPIYPTLKKNNKYRIMGTVIGGWRPLKL